MADLKEFMKDIENNKVVSEGNMIISIKEYRSLLETIGQLQALAFVTDEKLGDYMMRKRDLSIKVDDLTAENAQLREYIKKLEEVAK